MSVQKGILKYFKRETMKRSPLVPLHNSTSKRLKSKASGSSCDSGKNETVTENSETCVGQGSKCDDSNKNVDKSNQSGSGVLTGNNSFIAPEPRLWVKNRIEEKRLKEKLNSLSEKYSILDPTLDLDWFAALEHPLSQPSFSKLNDFVNVRRKVATVYPPEEKVWTWTKYCKFEELKVIIIGQDPYHHYGQAHGLCFSVPVGVKKPPSLVNIMKELSRNYDNVDVPDHGNLIGWAMQGVLLLNVVLTVEEKAPNSHKNQGWEDVTFGFIKYINEHFDGLVFMLWGNNAMKVAEFVNKDKHHILTAGHPSPLAVRLFFGCRHFKKCNEILKKQEKVMINWDWLPSGVNDPDNLEIDEIKTRRKTKFDKFQIDMLKPFVDMAKFNNWTDVDYKDY